MTKTIYDWATDGTYAAVGDPYDGAADVVVPPDGLITQGPRPKKQLAAQYFNWVVGQIATALQQTRALPPMNFLHTRTNTIPVAVAKYSKTTNTWYGVGLANDQFVRSVGGYDNWGVASEVGAGSTARIAFDFAIAGAGAGPGDILVMNYVNTASYASGNWRYYKASTTTWTQGNRVGLAAAQLPAVCYEPVTDRFVGFTNLSGGSGFAFYVPTGAPPVFNNPGAGDPTGFVALGNPGVTVGADGLGNVVAVQFDTTNSALNISKSSDGGSTWSAATVVALGFVPVSSSSRFCSPVWNGRLWMVVALATGVAASKVYTSPDGVTWTLASSQTTAATAIYGSDTLAAVGTIWAAWRTGQGCAFSFDDGVTWHITGRIISATIPVWMASDGLRLLTEPGAGVIWASVAIGTGF